MRVELTCSQLRIDADTFSKYSRNSLGLILDESLHSTLGGGNLCARSFKINLDVSVLFPESRPKEEEEFEKSLGEKSSNKLCNSELSTQ
jgi:hypothetical protein